MKTEIIDENFYRISFKPLGETHFGNNIYYLRDKNRVLLIDTGYYNQGRELKRYFKDKGMKIDTVVLSHYHDDHIEGLDNLNPLNIYGHYNFQETLDKWTPTAKHKEFIPNRRVKDNTTIKYGSHTIEIIPITGHSESDLLIIIDKKYIHIGDLILSSENGDPILPSVERSLNISHREALLQLKSYTEYTFLLSHGKTITDKNTKEEEIDKRVKYIDALIKNPDGISYLEAIKNSFNYLHREWHDLYYK